MKPIFLFLSAAFFFPKKLIIIQNMSCDDIPNILRRLFVLPSQRAHMKLKNSPGGSGQETGDKGHETSQLQL